LNKDPRYGWLEINSSVKISDSPTLEIKTLYFVDQDANVIAYSPPPSRYTGALKLNVVATVPSAEILISAGSLIISENGSIFCVGTPFCIVRIWNVMGISMSSFVWKNTSQLVMNTPVSSTTWNEPDSAYKTTYPFNRVFKTEAGHTKEYDDTEGEERIHEYHSAGTFYEIDKDGNKTTRIVKDNYEIIAGTDYVNIKGDCNLTVDSNCNTHVKGNWNIQVDGNKIENIKGTSTETVDGVATKTFKGTGSEVTAKNSSGTDIKLTKHTHTDPSGLAGNETSTPN